MDEGVIKFTLVHEQRSLYFSPEISQRLKELNTWRHAMFAQEVIGCNLTRYGACYGNVSMRSTSEPKGKGFRSFLISATQTGNIEHLNNQHYTRVYRYDHAHNKVWAEGPKEPSSESMTHGAVYDLPLEINVIFHIHSPQLWKKASALGIPVSDARVAYGTPEMAQEVSKLYKTQNLEERKIFSMGGHEDGIVAFGASAQEVGSLLLSYLLQAQ